MLIQPYINGKISNVAYIVNLKNDYKRPPVVMTNGWVLPDVVTTTYFHYNVPINPVYCPINNIKNGQFSFDWIAINIDNEKQTRLPDTTLSCPIVPSLYNPSPYNPSSYNPSSYSPLKNDIIYINKLFQPSTQLTLTDTQVPINITDCVYTTVTIFQNETNQGGVGSTVTVLNSAIAQVLSGSVEETSPDYTYNVTIGINLETGFYSGCTAIGNLLVQLICSTDYPLNVIFQPSAYSENFQFYVLWGTSSNMIYGPFTISDIPTLQFGHEHSSGCGMLNVKCQIKKWANEACVNIVNQFSIKPTIDKLCEKIAEEVAPVLGIECDAAGGGPEDPIADVFCTSFEVATNLACDAISDAVTNSSNLGQMLCDKATEIF